MADPVVLWLMLAVGVFLGWYIGRWRTEIRFEMSAQKLREELDGPPGETKEDGAERRYRLLGAYSAQALTQSKTSFAASLTAAGLGFVVILVGAGAAISGADPAVAILPVVGGAVIDAVALLFFSQDRRHQKTMFDFFEKLREDRKLDESLEMVGTISDDEIRARVQAALVLNFAQVPDALDVLRVADRRSGEDKPTSE